MAEVRRGRTSSRRELLLLTAGWMGAVVVPLLSRPLLPIDETRYVSVAWEMWLSGDFLVPHLNGTPYSDKPPLVFWLVVLGWQALGVEEWWPRLVSPLFALTCLLIVRRLAQLLWPGQPRVVRLAPFVLLGTLLYTVLTSFVMLDMPLVFFVLLAIYGLVHAGRRGGGSGWILFGTALGLGTLVKGPVILLFTLPAALLARFWAAPPVEHTSGAPRWSIWYGSCALAFLAAAAIALSWAVPAAAAGGGGYGEQVLWQQTTGRLARSFAHARPVWWYVPLLPVLLFPWSLWPPAWRGLPRLRYAWREPGVRFCVAWLVPSLVGLSLISGKQPHYVLPAMPSVALLVSRAVATRTSPRRWDAVPVAAVLLLAGAALALARKLPPHASLPEWTAAISPATGIVLCAAAVALVRFVPPDLERGVRVLALCSVFFVALLHVGVFRAAAPFYDVRPIAAHLRVLEDCGAPIAHVGRYHDQYQFAGRLRRPLDVIDEDEVPSWIAAHSGGRVISYSESGAARPPAGVEYSQRFRGRIVSVRSRDAVTAGLLDASPPR